MSPTRNSVTVTATSDFEQELARQWGIVMGVDEVGRGALAGPVCVGAVVIDVTVGLAPEGLTDSKKLTPRRREAYCQPIQQWTVTDALGWASNDEIDQVGITGALRLAGHRAFWQINDWLISHGRSPVSVVLLDGKHDWFTPPPPDLLGGEDTIDEAFPPVITRVKADLECTAVAAASVLAKVARDRHMEGLEDAGYDWARNKGYSSAAHIAGLEKLGAGSLHRRSWRLPGVN